MPEHCGNNAPHHQHLFGPDDALQYCKGLERAPLPDNITMRTLRILSAFFNFLLLRILIERLKRRQI
jgi:hypothetical protein